MVNLIDFFIKRPLRWLFGQLFGSKAKTYFDEFVAGKVEAAIVGTSLDLNIVIPAFIDQNLDRFVNDAMTFLRIPGLYRAFLAELFLKHIQELVDKHLR